MKELGVTRFRFHVLRRWRLESYPHPPSDFDTIGAIIIRIGYYTIFIIRSPQNMIGNCLGPCSNLYHHSSRATQDKKAARGGQMGAEGALRNIAALIIRMGFGGPFYYKYI